MKCHLLLVITLVMVLSIPGTAQDGLNLPTELYILTNEGQVQRFGIGAAGVETITRDDRFVLDFAVAPDNTLMAYRTEAGLYISRTGDESGGLLAEGESAGIPPVRGAGSSITWTPSGDALAYTTVYGARVMFPDDTLEPDFADIVVSPVSHMVWSPDGTHIALEVENNIWWVYRREMNEMNLASAITSSSGLTWRDDSTLVFAPEAGGLYQMDLAAANEQTLLLSEATLYRYPYIKPDGTLVVFSIEDQGARFRQYTFTTNGLDEGEAGVSPVDLNGVRWAPGGTLLTQFIDGAVSLVLPQTGQGFTLPTDGAVSYSWGTAFPASASGFSMTYGGYFLSPDANGFQQVWSLPRNGIPPIPLTDAPTNIIAYGMAGDGSGIAYATADMLYFLALDPSGAPGQVQELTALDGEVLSVDVRTDGSAVAYTVVSTDESVESGLYVLVEGTQPQRLFETLPVNDTESFVPYAVEYAPNGGTTRVMGRGGEARGQFLVAPDATLTYIGNFNGADWLDDGRLVVYEDGITPGELYIVDPTSGETSLALRVPNSIFADAAQTGVGQVRALYAPLRLLAPSPVNIIDVQGGEPDDVANIGFINSPQLSPDGMYVAGYTGEGGSLVIYSVEQGQALTLVSPNQVSAFRWATFR